MASPSKTRRRPTLGRDSMTGGSYIEDHQEYKYQQRGPAASIDDIMEASIGPPVVTPSLSTPSLSSRKSHTTVAIPPSPSLVRDSGIVHAMSHTNCIPDLEDAPKLVATLYYNSKTPRHAHSYADTTNLTESASRLPPAQIPEGSAPTTKIADYPLEPPAPESESLDHLYGAHLSQLCLTHFLSYLDDLLSHNPPTSRRLTSSHRCLAPNNTSPRVMEVTFSPPPNPEYLPFNDLKKHESIYRFEREWNCEVILQQETIFRRYRRLVVFDMDSTLIEQEVIDEIASFIGVKEQVSAITERAMNGELDFAASLKARVALLKGVPSDVFEKLKPRIRITRGARDFCKLLKRLGCQMAVLSGGFQPLADWLADELGLDHAFANHLISDPLTNTLTGELDPDFPIVDSSHKQRLLISLARGKGIPLIQTMAVGDGANDIPMLQTAGLGVAWNAKPKVQLEVPARLNVGESMLDLAYLLGLTQAEISELLAD